MTATQTSGKSRIQGPGPFQWSARVVAAVTVSMRVHSSV
jgi:hypothetical protein